LSLLIYLRVGFLPFWAARPFPIGADVREKGYLRVARPFSGPLLHTPKRRKAQDPLQVCEARAGAERPPKGQAERRRIDATGAPRPAVRR